jgi:hypothetical protein
LSAQSSRQFVDARASAVILDSGDLWLAPRAFFPAISFHNPESGLYLSAGGVELAVEQARGVSPAKEKKRL